MLSIAALQRQGEINAAEEKPLPTLIIHQPQNLLKHTETEQMYYDLIWNVLVPQ